MKKNQLAITGLLLAGSLMIRPAEKVVHAQHSHDLPKPMGVEAFTVIRQFLDYDRGLPLDARTDAEIMLVANLISLTPGTLSLDLSEDRKLLYIHVMFLDDIEQTRRQIKEGLEKRVLEVMR